IFALFRTESYIDHVYLCFFLIFIRPSPISTLFPYTTLFRSHSFLRDEPVQCMDLKSFGRELYALKNGRCGCHSRHQVHMGFIIRSEEHTSELQSRENLVCRLLLEKKKWNRIKQGRKRKQLTR